MKKVLAVAIIAILFISTFAVLTQMTNAQLSATSATPKPNISVQPSQKAAAIGVPFSVDVAVDNIDISQRVINLQFRMKYDSSMLKVTNVTEGPFLKKFSGTVFLYAVDDDVNLYGPNVLVGDQLLLNASGVFPFPHATWPETFATITFIPLATTKPLPTTTLLTLVPPPGDIMIVNEDLKEVACTATNGIVQIARVAFDLKPSPVQVALGESFSMDMVVSGVDLDERVTGIQFRVLYDSNLLQVTGVTEGPFLKQFGTTFFIYAIDDDVNRLGPNVLVGNLLLPDANGVWAAFPSGTGTVATITFKNIGPRPKYAPTTTQLTIVDNLVVNDNEPPADNEVPSSVSSEVVQIELPDPAILSIFPGQSFAVFGHPLIVSVMMSDLKAAWRTVGLQFRLCYDKTLFEVTDVTEGSFMKKFGSTTFLYAIDDDFATYGGNVLVGILLNPDANGVWAEFPHGDGELAIITLNPIVDVGIDDPELKTTLTLKGTLIVNDWNDEVGEALHSTNDAYVTILPTAQPTLSVDPQLTQVLNVSTPFSVNVDVSELSVGWEATAVQFRLMYDDEYLEVLEVTEGPFLKQFGTTFFIYAIDDDVNRLGPNVLVGNLLLPDANGVWAAFPSGSGTVATIKFNVTSLPRGLDQQPTHVNLGLLDQYDGKPESCLVDVDLEYIPTNLLGGEARINPTHIADVNSDGKVNMLDIGYVAHDFGVRAGFGTKPGHPRWNPAYDVVIDGVIDMRDIGTVARNFGWPRAS